MPSRLGETCFSCSKEFKVSRLLTVLDYKDPLVVRLIKTYKYRFVKDIAYSLQYLLKKFLIALAKEKSFNIAAENPLFVPVPLQRVRENWRGFNQAELISKLLADSLSLESINALEKIFSSSPQAEKESKHERLATPDSYKTILPEKISGRHIILVDDVATTGATLNACAKELLDNGAASVGAITIARG
jgi:competence protein ComFC